MKTQNKIQLSLILGGLFLFLIAYYLTGEWMIWYYDQYWFHPIGGLDVIFGYELSDIAFMIGYLMFTSGICYKIIMNGWGKKSKI